MYKFINIASNENTNKSPLHINKTMLDTIEVPVDPFWIILIYIICIYVLWPINENEVIKYIVHLKNYCSQECGHISLKINERLHQKMTNLPLVFTPIQIWHSKKLWKSHTN